MGKMIKIIILLLILVVLPILSYADEVEIPFGFWKQDFINDAKLQGFDLSGERGSDGYIEDKGMRMVVYTYRTITIEELTLIKDLSFKHFRKDNG